MTYLEKLIKIFPSIIKIKNIFVIFFDDNLINYLENSILKFLRLINILFVLVNVIDIDNDGYMELISVLATFKLINAFSQFSMNDKHSLQLISKVNIFQLEENLIQEFEN